MPNLRSTLDSLAHSFASAVLDVIRTASLDELVGETRGSRPGARRSRGSSTANSGPTVARASARPPKPRGGRLARRSPEDIARTLAKVVGLVKASRTGLRSEEIRAALKLDRREVPRVLKDGLAKKKLRSKGQKRATTYSAA